MRPEARPIEFTNGHAHFYGKKKVDREPFYIIRLQLGLTT